MPFTCEPREHIERLSGLWDMMLLLVIEETSFHTRIRITPSDASEPGAIAHYSRIRAMDLGPASR